MAIVGGVAAATGAIGSAVIGSNASSSAANSQQQAANQASATQLQMFNTDQANLTPYMNYGMNALANMTNFMNGPGSQSFQYNPASDPEYNFLLQQGTNAITSQASALGGVNSGATLKSLSDYGQQTALQSYQTEFNNWNTQLNNLFGRYSTMVGVGENAAAGVGNNAITTGQSIGSNTIGAGNAAAAGTVGSANALAGGVQSFFNSPSFMSTLSSLGTSGGNQVYGTTASGNPIYFQ